MSSDKPGESSSQPASGSSVARQVGTLRDASSTQPTSRVIGNVLNRRAADGAGGRGRMMFMPNKVVRRKGEDGVVVKQEPGTSAEATNQETSRGEGRGRGDGRGRGRGRGGPPAPVEMVASGPFALGPAAGPSRRPTKITAGAAAPPGHGGGQPHGAGLTDTAAPTLEGTRKLQKRRAGLEAADKEQYSDDEGVEIVDMDDVNELDWMAPDSLVRVKEEEEEKAAKKRDRLKGKIKDKAPPKFKMDPEDDVNQSESLLSSRDASTVRTGGSGEEEDKLLANALDLSESEEEEEMEDLVEDFLASNQTDDSFSTSQNRLYYFQFPRPFPAFELPTKETEAPDVEMADADASSTKKDKQKVTFAGDTLSDEEEAPPTVKAEEQDGSKPTGGRIGQLEIYRSGLVKMRLGDGIVMEVTAATQPSFLQHAVYHDDDKKRLVVLGEVNRRFLVSPDIDQLLEDMLVVEEREKERKRKEEVARQDGLIRMDD